MIKNTWRFLWASLIAVLILCTGVFMFMTEYMLRRSDESIKDVGRIYVSEVNSRLRENYNSVMQLRFLQMNSMLERIPTETAVYGEEFLTGLAENGRMRGFTHLALYSGENLEMIYGDTMTIINETPFISALGSGENRVSSGVTDSGEAIFLLAVPAVYPMGNGETSVALLAGLPMEYDSTTQSQNDTLIYSYLIGTDGTYAAADGQAPSYSYFDKLMQGAEFEGQTAEEGVSDIKRCIAAGEDYSVTISVNGEQRHMYCAPLPLSDWYMVTVMPYGKLDSVIANLGYSRIYITLAGCALILLSFAVVFLIYFRLSVRQMRELENAKKEAVRANMAKSQFLSNVSHDIRTPMNAIVGMTAIASANINDSERVKDCLNKISVSGRHLLGLINDVLDMSKIESGKLSLNMERTSLREITDGIASIMRPRIKEKNQNFKLINNITVENVYCDGVRLNQVLLNLLANAVKFTPEGGDISVTLSQESSPLGEEHVRVHFYVKDNGIGMSEEFQEKIFDSFVREDSARVHKTEGTGLGMAITKYIVDEMKGMIEVTSAPDKGSEFHVVLDLKKAEDDEPDMSSSEIPGQQDYSGKRILVAEDNDLNWEIASELLSMYGIDAERAENGQICVDKFSVSEQGYYDAILMDIRMPVMTGYKATSVIRSLERPDAAEIPIIAMTADAFEEDIDRCLKCGMNAHIAKPIDMNNFLSILQKNIK